jgi:hypothetical protein
LGLLSLRPNQLVEAGCQAGGARRRVRQHPPTIGGALKSARRCALFALSRVKETPVPGQPTEKPGPRGVASRSRRISPSATARLASEGSSMRSFPAPGTSGVGFTRPPTCSTTSPSRCQVNMKTDRREIYGAPTRPAAEAAIDVFADKYGAKYHKAVTCLTKDRKALLAFFDFPAEHWDHLRTSNPIESVFATVRLARCGRREPCRRRPPSSWCSNSSTPPPKPGCD